jgi:hypothetical protein
VAAVEAIKLGGIEGIAFYNYGHWRLPVFDRVRDALAAWGVS